MARRPSRKFTVGVVVTEPERLAIEAAAEAANMSLSSYTRGVLTRHLSRTGRLPAPTRPPAREQETAA